MRQKSVRRGVALVCIAAFGCVWPAGAQAPAPGAPKAPPAGKPSADVRAQVAKVGAIFNKALQLQRAGKVAEAKKGYEDYLHAVNSYHLPPRASIPALMNMAQIARGLHNSAEESRLLEQVIHIDPKYAGAVAQLATASFEQQRYTEAAAMARRSLELKPAPNFAAAAHYTLGAVAAQRRDYPTAEREFRACMDIAPDNPQTVMNYARILDYEKKYPLAFDAVSRIAASHPTDMQLQLFRAYLAANLHRYDIAIATYNQILVRDSKNAPALFGRAAAYQSMGKPDDAIDAFLTALTAHPDDAAGQANVAQLYYQQGKYTAAKNHFEIASKLLPNDAHMLDRLALCQAEEASRLVDLHEKGAGLAAAEANFKRALTLAPTDIVVEDSLAFFYTRVGRYTDAEAVYRKEIVHHPDKADAYASLARMFELSHHLPEAVKAWQEYRKRYPDDLYSCVELARLDAAQGNNGKAVEEWRDYLSRHPKDTVALVALAQVQTQMGKFDDARSTYAKVLDPAVTGEVVQDPKSKKTGQVQLLQNRLQAYYGLANVAHQEKKLPEEIRYLNQAIQLENASAARSGAASHEGYKTLAEVYEQNKMVKEAAATYEAWAKQDPRDSTPLTLLARLQDRTGQSTQAAASFEKAAARAPDPVAATMERAEIFHKNRDFQTAISLYERILSRNPNDSRVFSPLAQLYDQTSQFEKGLAMWRALVKADKNAEWANDHVATDLVRLKRYGEARTVYMAELDVHPQNAQTYADIGHTFELEGKLEEYLPLLQKRLQKTPAELSLMAAVLAEYTRLKRPDEGWTELQKTADASADPAAADTSLALLYLKAGKQPEGLAEYKRIADRKPEDYNLRSVYAQQLYANGQTEEAIKTFNQILARKDVPKEAQIPIRRQLMAWYEQDKKHQDAIAQARAILALMPGDFGATVTLADLLNANGGEAEAANLFLEVSKNETYPANIRSQLHVRVGDIYLKLNRQADAVAQYQEAVKLDPKNGNATAALKKAGGGQ
jgi:tetratricopeptide (TPR) repeat protein